MTEAQAMLEAKRRWEQRARLAQGLEALAGGQSLNHANPYARLTTFQAMCRRHTGLSVSDAVAVVKATGSVPWLP